MTTPSPDRSQLSRFAGSAGQAPESADSSARAIAADFRLTAALVVITCAIVPAYVVRWHAGPLPTTLLESGVLLTLIAFAVESLRARTWPAWRNALTLPAALFLVVGIISIVVAPDRRAALGLYRAYLLEPIGFGLVVLNVTHTARRGFAIGCGLFVGAAVAGVLNAAVVLVALGHRDFNVLNTPPVIIYNTANAVALYLVPLIALAAAVTLHWPSPRERLAALGFLVIAVPSVLLSFSRGGYLALAAVALGLAVSHRRRLLLLAAGAVSAGLLLLIPAIRHRVEGEIDLNSPNNTLVGRFHLWSAALQMLRDHPIFGAGLSGFAKVLGPYWNPTHTDRFTYPHNIVLNFWTETGLLGVVAFGWIMAAGFIRSWRGWHQAAPEWKAIQLGVFLALVAVIVHGLVDVPYWKNDLSLEFWVLLGLSFAPALENRTQSGRPEAVADGA
jgi:O-antigen ligase